MSKNENTGLGLYLLIGAKHVFTNDRPSIIFIIVRLFPSAGEINIMTRFAGLAWKYYKACSVDFLSHKSKIWPAYV